MNNRQPHNIEAEQSVIGAAFISKSALQKVCEELDNTSFFNEAHGKIFDVLKELYQSGIAVDIMTVTDRLKAKKLLKEKDGNIANVIRESKWYF